MTTLGRLVW